MAGISLETHLTEARRWVEGERRKEIKITIEGIINFVVFDECWRRKNEKSKQ